VLGVVISGFETALRVLGYPFEGLEASVVSALM